MATVKTRAMDRTNQYKTTELASTKLGPLIKLVSVKLWLWNRTDIYYSMAMDRTKTIKLRI